MSNCVARPWSRLPLCRAPVPPGPPRSAGDAPPRRPRRPPGTSADHIPTDEDFADFLLSSGHGSWCSPVCHGCVSRAGLCATAVSAVPACHGCVSRGGCWRPHSSTAGRPILQGACLRPDLATAAERKKGQTRLCTAPNGPFGKRGLTPFSPVQAGHLILDARPPSEQETRSFREPTQPHR